MSEWINMHIHTQTSMHTYIKEESSFSKKNFKYRSNDGIKNYKYSFMLMIATGKI